MTTTNHRIWPGPECLKTRELQPGDLVVLGGFPKNTEPGFLTAMEPLVGAAVLVDAVGDFVDAGGWLWPRSAVTLASDHRRSLGIAMALEAARRRERFARWLKPLMFHEHTWARARRFHGTPEAFVMRCDWHDLRVLMACAEFEPESMPTQKAVRLALLASPEWLSLPWQRESEGVGRG